MGPLVHSLCTRVSILISIKLITYQNNGTTNQMPLLYLLPYLSNQLNISSFTEYGTTQENTKQTENHGPQIPSHLTLHLHMKHHSIMITSLLCNWSAVKIFWRIAHQKMKVTLGGMGVF